MVLDKEGLSEAFKIIHNCGGGAVSLSYDDDSNLICTLKDNSGNTLSTSTVAFPIDNLIVSATKASDTCTFTFLDNTTLTIPAAEIADWAKASTKPTYTYSEVGADKSGAADTALASAKSYTDSKVSSVYRYKGTVDSYSSLSSISSPTVGDVQNCEDTGMNYAYTSSGWDALGSTVDLSAYVQTTDLATVATTGSYSDLTDTPSIDTSLSTSSTNAVTNSVITNALDNKADVSHTHDVATNSADGFMSAKDKTRQVYFVEGTQTSATNEWTGTCDEITDLYDGLTIRYQLPYAGTSTAATLALNGGTAYPVYNFGTNTITSHLSAGSLFQLTFRTSLNVAGTTYTNRWVLNRGVDNNSSVTQTNTTTNANYRIIFSRNASDTSETSSVRKSSKFLVNPSTGELTATSFIGDLSGNADTATTANRIQVLTSDPSSPATGEIWIIDS